MFKMLDFSAVLATCANTPLNSKAKTFDANTEACVLGRKNIFCKFLKGSLVHIQTVIQSEFSPIRKKTLKHRDTILED